MYCHTNLIYSNSATMPDCVTSVLDVDKMDVEDHDDE
jgi:hypothetical protein